MSFTAPVLPLEVYGEANIRLGHIEAAEEVTILFAVESGSRAWGFPSPDSDQDVRFFYIRPLSHYVGLLTTSDVIECAIDGPWDINGWDLKKALLLLLKGNATAMEWLSSPLIYREHGPLPYRLRDLIKRHATWEGSARHYYGLANTCYQRDIVGRSKTSFGSAVTASDVNQKKYLYAVRAACCISWIRNYSEIPPMSLPALMSLDIMPKATRAMVHELLKRKATMGEFGIGPRIQALDEFIEDGIVWVKKQGFDNLPIPVTFTDGANRLLLNALGIG